MLCGTNLLTLSIRAPGRIMVEEKHCTPFLRRYSQQTLSVLSFVSKLKQLLHYMLHMSFRGIG